MKIKKIPIADLMVYFNEIFENRANEDITSIPEMIEEYYYIMTGISLPDYNEIFLENWCFGNLGIIDNMPWGSGVVVKNDKGQYGITCWIGPQNLSHEEDELLNVIWIDQGIIKREIFHSEDWKEWGTMSMFFEYEFEDNMLNILGSRELGKGCCGRDVWMLQKLMKNFDNSVETTMIFDDATETKLMEIQAAFSRPITGVIVKDDPLLPLLLRR